MINYEEIDKYIHNELSSEERIRFEEQLKKDPTLEEAYQLYSSIENTMQSDTKSETAFFTENLQPFQKKYFTTAKSKKTGKVKRVFFLAISAAAILILVLTVFPIGNGAKMTNEELYAQYTPFEKVTEITRGSTKDSLFNIGSSFYNNKKYTEAIPYFEKVLDSNAQAHFLYAVCFIETNNYPKAYAALDDLINGQSSYREKAEFYKALLFLKQNKVDACKQMLLSINRYSSYNDQAKALYKKLEP